jgi:hypothetical protein
MSGPFANFLIATPQSQTQFMLQFLEIGNLPLNIGQFFFETASHGSTGLQAAASQFQEIANFFQCEPQVLHSPNELKCFDIALTVLAVATWCSGRAWQQAGALVEPNCIHAEADLLGHGPDLHRLGSSRKSYTLEYSPESTSFWRWIGAADEVAG